MPKSVGNAEPALLASIEGKVRAIHHYGNPPDSRLQDDVDGDVEDILDDVRRIARGVGNAEPAIVPTESQMWDLANACDAARRQQTWEPVLDLFAKLWGPKVDERPDEEPTDDDA